jgi:hypothetical protein
MIIDDGIIFIVMIIDDGIIFIVMIIGDGIEGSEKIRGRVSEFGEPCTRLANTLNNDGPLCIVIALQCQP